MSRTDNQTERAEQRAAQARSGRRSPVGFLFLFFLICALGLVGAGYVNSLRRSLSSMEAEISRLEGELTALREEQAAVPEPEPEPEPQPEEETPSAPVPAPDYDDFLPTVAHRGLSALAPENTLPAYVLAWENGFAYVETDVRYTADGVAVCLHDPTVNRTSDGTGEVGSLTLEELRALDFGAWKSPDYAGTIIPTFEEFLALCRELGLHPYIELKSNAGINDARVKELVNMVRRLGLRGRVTWISFSSELLFNVRYYDNAARLGFLVNSITPEAVNTVRRLRTSQNQVIIDSSSYTDEELRRCVDAGIPLEVWTVNDESAILALDPYITGVTSDVLLAGKVLYEDRMTRYGTD